MKNLIFIEALKLTNYNTSDIFDIPAILLKAYTEGDCICETQTVYTGKGRSPLENMLADEPLTIRYQGKIYKKHPYFRYFRTDICVLMDIIRTTREKTRKEVRNDGNS